MRQRTFLLWTTVEQRKERETAAWRVAAAENGLAGSGPYEAHLLAAQSGLENDDEMLVQAEQEILKDVKRTFPWLEPPSRDAMESAVWALRVGLTP